MTFEQREEKVKKRIIVGTMTPNDQAFMLPILKSLQDGRERTCRETVDFSVNFFKLTKTQMEELSQSGHLIYKNRIEWAVTYLKKYKLIESLERGIFKITSLGIEFLNTNPEKIDVHLLRQYSEFKNPQYKKVEKEVVSRLESKIDSHKGAQYYILTIGQMEGYLTYTPDVSSNYQGKKLRDVTDFPEMPIFTSEVDRLVIKKIDVLWFDKSGDPIEAFEIEHSTDIVKGMDRLLQLKKFTPKLRIVAPEDKRVKYESILNRTQYRSIEYRFGFLSYNDLFDLYNKTLALYNCKKKYDQ